MYTLNDYIDLMTGIENNFCTFQVYFKYILQFDLRFIYLMTNIVNTTLTVTILCFFYRVFVKYNARIMYL